MSLRGIFTILKIEKITTTSEVIYLQSGKIEVEIYDTNKKFVQNVLVKEENDNNTTPRRSRNKHS